MKNFWHHLRHSARAVMKLCFCAGLFLLLSPVAARSQSSLTDSQRHLITYEALSRLEKTVVDKNPEVQVAIARFLEKTGDPAQFIAIVKRFQLTNQEDGLLRIAAANPSGESGVEAMRLLLSHADETLLRNVLKGDAAIQITEALGNVARKEAVPFLLPIVQEELREIDLRRQAVRSLVRTEEGSQALLRLADAGQLPRALALTAGTELRKAHWEPIRWAADKIFPAPVTRDEQALPPVSEMIKLTGNAETGKAIFFRTETACATCHQVNGRGTEIGPDLSVIGDKLGPEALFESILEPSAGISFGFEAHQVELKSGDEFYGLIVSETDDELVMKDLQGIVTRHQKSEITRRQKMNTSIMPDDLERTMTAAELIDLVAYLSTLRKPD